MAVMLSLILPSCLVSSAMTCRRSVACSGYDQWAAICRHTSAGQSGCVWSQGLHRANSTWNARWKDFPGRQHRWIQCTTAFEKLILYDLCIAVWPIIAGNLKMVDDGKLNIVLLVVAVLLSLFFGDWRLITVPAIFSYRCNGMVRMLVYVCMIYVTK